MAELKNAYCISCGEVVEFEKVNLGIEGEELLRCRQCGAYLGTAKSVEMLGQNLETAQDLAPSPPYQEQEVAPPIDFEAEASLVSPGPIPEVPGDIAPAGEVLTRAEDEVVKLPELPEPGAPKLDAIILAEDSELIRRILKDMIVKKGLGRRVISCDNGFELLVNYIENLANNQPMGLIILDVVMPVLNGISAAVALRAWERAVGLSPAPILFFTVKRCDETFKRVIQHTRPAMYINKGTSDSANQLEIRIEKLITRLLKERF